MAGNKFKPQYRRILHIHHLLKGNRYPNAVTIARDRNIECSERTVKRDIEYMRDELTAPIEYDASKRGYYYAEAGYELPSILMVTEGELFSLSIAEHILEQYRNTPVFPKLQNVFSKIGEMLPAGVSVGRTWLESVFSFTSLPGVKVDDNVWTILFAGLKNKKKVLMWYTAPGYEKPLKRTFAPYHVFCNNGQWYVIGHDSYSDDIRLFALHRIGNINQTDFVYSVPEDFNYKDYIDAPLGMFIDEEIHEVILLFSEDAAPYIREREWHPEQKIEENDDGGIVLTFRTRQLVSVLHWILSWGGAVKVLAPEKLVSMTKDSLNDALERYK
jgi:predicted DNA-binding transcriptional regulator YafY